MILHFVNRDLVGAFAYYKNSRLLAHCIIISHNSGFLQIQVHVRR